MIEAMSSSAGVGAIGWSLVVFLWQGALVGSMAALMLWSLSGCDPRWRYALSCLALLVMTALPICTAVLEYQSRTTTPEILTSRAPRTLPDVEGLTPRVSQRGLPTDSGEPSGRERPSEAGWIGWVVFLWAAGVSIFSLRLAGGWILLRRLCLRSEALAEPVSASVHRLARRLRVRQPVSGRESAMVDVPTVIGWLKPVILLPSSSLSGLSRLELEAILAHELAHIRRHDYAINLLQRASETLLFYHPAVWWLSGRIRAEREMCADDLAVAVCGDRRTYASALRSLEEARSPRVPAVAANGGSLAGRIARLLGQRPAREGASPVWIGILLVAAALVAVAAGESNTQAAPQPLLLAELSTPEVPQAGEPTPETDTTPAPGPKGGTEAGPLAVPTEAEPGPLAPGVSYEETPLQGAVMQYRMRLEEERAEAERLLEQSQGETLGPEQLAAYLAQAERARSERAEAERLLEQSQGETLGPEQLPAYERARREFGRFFSEPRSDNALLNQVLFPFDAPDLRLGLEVQNMTPELREFFGVPREVGALVAAVEGDSIAAAAGIEVGDVIVSVEGSPVASEADLNLSLEIDAETLALGVVRDALEREVTLNLDLPPRQLRIAP